MIELLSGTALSMPVSKAIEDDTVHPYTSLLALTEAEYILCRDIGWDRAREKVEKLILSRAIEIVENEGSFTKLLEPNANGA